MRFEEFTDNWDELKLDSLSKKIIAGATPKTSVGEYWIDGTIYWMSSGEIHKKKIYSTDKMITQEGYDHASTTMIPINCVLIALAGQGITRGTVAVNKIELCTNQSIASIITNDKLNYNYLFYYLEKNYEKLRSLSNSDGGKGSLNLSILKSLKIKLPMTIEEQTKISSFITKIDEKVELLTNKKDEIIKFKQYLLQNMFPKKGETVPKLRFEEFTEEWKSVQIKDIFSERNETNFDELALLSVTLNNGVIPRSEIDGKDNSINNKNNYKHVKPQDIVYNSMRMWQGANGVSTLEGIVSPAYTVLIPKKDICSDFYGYYFKINRMLNEFKKYSQGLTSDTWNLKYPLISQITIKTTSREEQEKIASFLSFVDKKIDLLYRLCRKHIIL